MAFNWAVMLPKNMGDATITASEENIFLYTSCMSSAMTHLPVSLHPPHSWHGLKLSSFNITFSVDAPPEAAPSSALSRRISVLPCLRGLPLIPRMRIYYLTFMASTGHCPATSLKSQPADNLAMTWARLSSPISNTSEQLDAQRPHPVHNDASTDIFAIPYLLYLNILPISLDQRRRSRRASGTLILF